MNYILIAEATEKWGITRRCVQMPCAQERIPGLTKLGESWAISGDVDKLADARKQRKTL